MAFLVYCSILNKLIELMVKSSLTLNKDNNPFRFK